LSYYFKPRNKNLEPFRMGWVTWGFILDDIIGYLYPYKGKGGRFIYNSENDKRFNTDYPDIINSDFRVTAEESRIMARMVRNFILLYKNSEEGDIEKAIKEGWKIETIIPRGIRQDIIYSLQDFADWAEKSQGFRT